MYAGVASWTGSQALTTSSVGNILTIPTRLTNCPVFLGGLWGFVNTISGAASLVVRLTRDAAGDECITPSFSSTISTGIGTAADGTIVVDYSRQLIIPSSSIYVFVATDAGTANLTEVKLTAFER